MSRLRLAIPPGHADAHCLVCRRDVIVSQGTIACPNGDHDVEVTSLAHMPSTASPEAEQRLADVVTKPSGPAEAGGGIPQQITLPGTREARAWDAATDALIDALEREESAALQQYEVARARVRAARLAAASFRRMRELVSVEQDRPAVASPKATRPSEPVVTTKADGEKPWSRAHPACVTCGTTASPHQGKGRCGACAMYWRTRGVERPRELWAEGRP